jgi:putative SOS response-associated peptidase YedK
MCGRYAVTSSPEAIRALFRYQELPNFPPRFNVAPTQPMAIVRLARFQAEWAPVSRPESALIQKAGARTADKFTQSAQARLLSAKPVPTFAERAPDGKRQFALVRWGLLPSWVKDPKTFSLLINARGETAIEKPAFRAAMRRRRCLIPADGFYEWKAVGGRKQPFFVRLKSGGPLAFAGLWETWSGPNGEELETAAIVTTRANRTLAAVHDRMPVIVPPQAFDLWLDGTTVDPQTAAALIAPAPEDLLEAYEVSTAVNRVANDNPKLVEPAAAMPPEQQPVAKPAATPRPKRGAKKDDGQASMF